MNPLARTIREATILAAYLAGAALFTFPLVLDLRRAVRDLADPLHLSWVLAWVVHQLPRDPLHLFDANIFYPEPASLAFSEHLVGLALLVAPIQAAFSEPVLSHNAALLLSIALSGYGACRLVREISGSEAAGAIAGSVFAYAPYRLGHLSHLQLQAAGFIPFVYLCLSRYLEQGRARHALGVAVFIWLTSASCGYYGVFTWILLAVAIPCEVIRTGTFRFPRRLGGLGIALALSALAYLPLALPYLRLERDHGFRRPLERVERASAQAGSYLRSGSRLHGVLGLKQANPEQTLFPGLTALVLGALALFKLDKRSGLYLAVGAAAVWASFGPQAGLYSLLHQFVPGVTGLRVPARFAIYALFALAVLAGLGAARVLKHLGGHKRRVAATCFALLPLIESFGGPLPYRKAPVDPPEVYRWLAGQPDPAPIVELPLALAKEDVHRNALYMLWSTSHFKPLANGYSSLVPASYGRLAEKLRSFPDPAGVEELRRLGIRFVILHRDLYLRDRAREMEEAMDQQAGLRMVHRTAAETVYELVPP